MPETIFIDRRKEENRRARSMSDGSVSNGLLHCRRRAKNRRQFTGPDAGFNWWLHVNYAATDNPAENG